MQTITVESMETEVCRFINSKTCNAKLMESNLLQLPYFIQKCFKLF